VRVFKKDGEHMLDHAISLNKKFRDSLTRLPQVILGNFKEHFASDPTKTIFKIKGLTGNHVAELLDKERINIEKSTQKCCVVTCHINITEQDIDQLILAVE
jgi:selenocysteine lyase/cysteine desulfurase